MEEKITYVADDGKTFDKRDECIFYEKVVELVEKECCNQMNKDDVVQFLLEHKEELKRYLRG
jgi:hypothetical protein